MGKLSWVWLGWAGLGCIGFRAVWCSGGFFLAWRLDIAVEGIEKAAVDTTYSTLFVRGEGGIKLGITELLRISHKVVLCPRWQNASLSYTI